MDRQGDDDCLVETAGQAQKSYRLMKKTLEYLVLVSFSFFLYTYFPGFPFVFSYNLQFSTLIYSLFAHALDRKCMFLICNGILAFLAKNLNFSSSSFNYYSGIRKGDEDGMKQTTELPAELENETVQVAEEEMETGQQKQEQGYEYIDKGAKEMKMEGAISETEGWEEEEEEKEEEDGDDDDDEVENKAIEGNTSPSIEVNDARVSTEELNQKFEEFIRKMKEELRIEAQQQVITV